MIEVLNPDPRDLNFRQRWASYLTLAVAVAGVLGAVLMRGRIEGATVPYEDKTAGIAVRYPTNWLLEHNQQDFIFRVRDPAAVPFKTTLQIQIVTVGPDASANEVLNLLNMDRASRLAAYRQLETIPISLSSILTERQPVQMTYAYVENEPNPFLQALPIVVEGIDIVVLRNAQAIVITYRSDADSFEKNRPYFDTFFRGLKIS